METICKNGQTEYFFRVIFNFATVAVRDVK